MAIYSVSMSPFEACEVWSFCHKAVV